MEGDKKEEKKGGEESVYVKNIKGEGEGKHQWQRCYGANNNKEGESNDRFILIPLFSAEMITPPMRIFRVAYVGPAHIHTETDRWRKNK